MTLSHTRAALSGVGHPWRMEFPFDYAEWNQRATAGLCADRFRATRQGNGASQGIGRCVSTLLRTRLTTVTPLCGASTCRWRTIPRMCVRRSARDAERWDLRLEEPRCDGTRISSGYTWRRGASPGVVLAAESALRPRQPFSARGGCSISAVPAVLRDPGPREGKQAALPQGTRRTDRAERLMLPATGIASQGLRAGWLPVCRASRRVPRSASTAAPRERNLSKKWSARGGRNHHLGNGTRMHGVRKQGA